MQSEPEAPGTAGAAHKSGNILIPGRNCFAVETARRAALLIDAEAYFATLEQVLRKATRSIVIIGWDFDARIRLRPQDGDDAPRLGELLRSLVEERPELEVRILIWSLAAVHAPGAALPLILGEEWRDHPRIQLRLDTNHPFHAAHHQKLVIIDDSLAFVGGMDLTLERWDTTRHEAEDPLRRHPDGTPYDPVHDLQLVVDGPVVRPIVEVARERWRDAVGEDIPPQPAAERWPVELAPDFTDVPVGVARTLPRLNGEIAVEESARLTEDVLLSARRTIYIEAQYFTAKRLRRILGDILQRPDGPEVVVVCTQKANGIIERFIMGANRERLLRSLKRLDRDNRLHVYHPTIPEDGGDHRLLVHAKLIIIDDTLLRIGSSNLNNRSVGLDSECDLAIEADRPETRAAILGCRDRLVAEHLDVDPALVRAATRREGGLSRAIDRLNRHPRGLRTMDVGPGPTHSFPGTRLLDPERPFRLVERLHRLLGRIFHRRRPRPQSTTSEKTSSRLPSARGRRK
ncbi:phospholipase D-like domain-containing protein [Nitratireductor sp. GCM10026969]|uniref:phospholipase D-like domain-containing protein n=1 Tax=Nitratireductor sp. GCM10026969 TaxID=3252645 RepID=UPI00360628BA